MACGAELTRRYDYTWKNYHDAAQQTCGPEHGQRPDSRQTQTADEDSTSELLPLPSDVDTVCDPQAVSLLGLPSWTVEPGCETVHLCHVQTRYTTADEEKTEGEGVETSSEVDNRRSEMDTSSLEARRTTEPPSIATPTYLSSFRHGPLSSEPQHRPVQDDVRVDGVPHIAVPLKICKEGPVIATSSNPSGLRVESPAFKEPRGFKPSKIPQASVKKGSKEVVAKEAKPLRKSHPKNISKSGGEASVKSDPSLRCGSFLDLPPEIRNRIYEYAVVENAPIHLDTPSPPVSRTNQLIRKESLYVYYRQNTFKIIVHNFERKRLVAFFETSKYSEFVRLNIWHKLVAETPTLKANLWDWVEKSYHYQAPLLGYAHSFVEGDFDVEIHAHRISTLFGILRDCQLGNVDWKLSKKILTKAIAGLGVCGERKVDRS